MSWKDKTFKEKEIFYKERQKFFDAVKAAKDGENPIVTYKKERYRLFHPESVWLHVEKNPNGNVVMFNKAFKSNIVATYSYGNKSGMSIWGEKHWSRRDWTRILCFAEKI